MQEDTSRTQDTSKRGGGFLKNILLIILALAIGVGATALIVKQKPEFLGLTKGSAQIQDDVDALVAEVGTIYALPTDEVPTIATITDVEKLGDQPFFRNAKNGDKVLVYTNASKAILYRPQEKRIIEVGAVSINKQVPQQDVEEGNETAIPQPTDTPSALPTGVGDGD
jgi:hypothetical protein